MKKLNINRFATADPDTFEMYTNHTENYDTFGNCTSITVSTVANLDIIQITKSHIKRLLYGFYITFKLITIEV